MSRALGFPTFEANKIGVRRFYTLGFLGSDTSSGMIAEGYDPVVINTLVSAGATDAQLQSLWDNYAANSTDFYNAANQLAASLAPGGSIFDVNPTMTAVSSTVINPTTAAPGQYIANSAWGGFDLTVTTSWTYIAGLFVQVQQLLNSNAQASPNDPQVISDITEFNSLVVQWAGYYQQAMGYPPSPLPMASMPSTLSGLGTLGDPVTATIITVAIVAAVAALLAELYNIYSREQTKQLQIKTTAATQNAAITGAQAAANSQLTQAAAINATAAALPPSQAAQAAALRAQAATMQQQAAALLGQTVTATTPPVVPAATSQLTTWFTQNWVGVAAVFLGVMVLPPLIKKL